jgi:hypothetical protein
MVQTSGYSVLLKTGVSTAPGMRFFTYSLDDRASMSDRKFEPAQLLQRGIFYIINFPETFDRTPTSSIHQQISPAVVRPGRRREWYRNDTKPE